MRKTRWYGFVTRDKNGDIFLWRREPEKDEEAGEWKHPIAKYAAWRYLTEDDLEPGLNPQWEDEKPIFVRIQYFAKTDPYKNFLKRNRILKLENLKQ